MTSPLPTSLGARFRVEEALADTPFERCFRAHDSVLQRDVLLKLPARAAFDGWTAPTKERLLREARALARVRHANVAPIHWVEETPEGPLLVLDLPEGELLVERLKRGPLEVAETVAIGVQIGEALAHVHLQGVVHRAVGPGTIRLLASGKAQLGSFTFAKEFGPGARGTSMVHARKVTAPGPLLPLMVPDYAAPEQMAGQAADPRADVFALGCTLFRCLAGREAFLPGRENEPMPDLRSLRKDVGRGLAEVIRKCTLFAKGARYATAHEVVQALQGLSATADHGGSRWRVAAVAGVAGLALAAWVGRDAWSGSDKVRGSGGAGVAGVPASPVKTYKPVYERLHGLFIAIGEGYAGTPWNRLANPVREIDEVLAQLQKNDPMWAAKGSITRLADADATRARIKAALDEIANTAGEDDGVLVYFAGHGAKDGDSFGLCAKDVQDDVAGGTGYVRREELTTFAKRCRAKHVLFVLDCCHSGAVFDPVVASRGRGVEDAPLPGEHWRQGFSREFLCSAAANQAASDGQGVSPFCALLLEELRRPATGARPYVVARHLGSRIAEAMDSSRSRTGALQMAKYQPGPDDPGSFVFLLPSPPK